MTEIKAVGADWIAVIPYAYTRQGETEVHFNSNRQWWGERSEGVIETIQRANKANVKVMLKPQVYFPGSWPGGLDFDKESDWEAWEKDYRKYIMTFVPIADSLNVPLFCIGTEFKQSEVKRAAFWRQLIKDIRAQYKGKLTYASNWDSYGEVPFWKELDYIGIDAYFPLLNEKIPSHEMLTKSWNKWIGGIRSVHEKEKKPVLFTEFGYLSVDGCSYNTWELEGKARNLPINEQAQANALNALFTVFSKEKYWAGGFLWKWFPNMKGHEGYPAHDYTPQGKLGEEVLRNWYEADQIAEE
ncbi:MAG: hypothetical protein ACI8YQ_002692 [Polaribacter sp.]|jgi:hypothetical protein